MRWKGIIALLILTAAAVAAALIFTDEWLETQMEKYGSRMAGALVEFDNVDFSIFQLRLSWNGLQVTNRNDTMKNLFETGFCEFQLAFKPLLQKKVLIQTMEVADVQYDTERTTDGSLPKKWEPKPKKSGNEGEDDGGFETPQFVKNIEADLRQEAAQMPVMNLKNFTQDFDVDSLLAMAELQTPAKADSLKQLYEQRYEEWKNRIDNLPDKQEVDELQNRVQKSVQDLQNIKLDEIKTPEDVENALAIINEASKTIKEISAKTKEYKAQFNEFQTAFKRDKKTAEELTSELPRWIQQDKEKILNLAKLPELSVENISQIVFGQRVINQVESINGYIGQARFYLAKFQGEKEPPKPERRKGIDVHFAPVKKESYPRFWVQKIAFSGKTPKEMEFSGVVENLSSDQKIVGRPTALRLQGTRKDQASLMVSGLFDYRNEQSNEQLTIRLSQLPLNGFRLSDTPLLPSQIESGTGTVAIKALLQRPAFDADIIFKADNLQFAPSAQNSDMDKRLIRISEQLAASINAIDFNAKIWKKQENEDLHFALHSNLDEQIARAAKQVFQQELERAKQQLLAKADAELQKYRRQLEAEIAKKEQELQKLIAQGEQQLNKQLQAVESQIGAFEEKIDDEKKKIEQKAADKIFDNLENLFNW